MNRSKEAARVTQKLASYYKNSLSGSDEIILLDRELQITRDYLDLQTMRYGDKFKYKFEVPSEVLSIKIPKMTLQPLVENAVTYGIRKTDSGTGTVTITSRRISDHVEVIVEDNGPGFDLKDALADKEKSHIGIKNVKERVERIANGELIIDSVIGRGTKAIIKLPLGEE
jgi:two-component system sensor histidine kinase YesM